MQQQSRWSLLAGAACLLIALCGGAGDARAAGDKEAGPGVEPVDINTATVEGLAAIPGIGPVTAQRIVEWREQHGPFRSVEDLMKVKGIGEKSLEKLRPYVKVSKSR
jgi:competence protein ComEA